MRELLLKQEEVLEHLADEVIELVTNSKKLSDVLRTVQENETIRRRNLNELVSLKNRIFNLENRFNNLTKNFKIDIVEAERNISEKAREIIEDNDQKITHLAGQIEDLRDMIVRIGNEVKRMKDSLKL